MSLPLILSLSIYYNNETNNNLRKGVIKMIKYFMCPKCLSIYKVEFPDIIEMGKDSLLRKTSFTVKVLCNKKIRNPKTKGVYLCKRYAVEIDRRVLYAVQNLNIKGYITEYCCEGHSKYNTGYITFSESMYAMLENLDSPEGWYFESPAKYSYKYDDNGNVSEKMASHFDPRPCIRYKSDDDKSSNDHIYALNRWVDSLPSLI